MMGLLLNEGRESLNLEYKINIKLKIFNGIGELN